MKYLPIIEYPDMRGFTLIEVTVVLFLMVLIIGISAVFIAGRLPSTTIDAAGREICAVIRYARSAALMQGEEKNVLMDLDSKYVAVEGGGYVYLPEDVRIAALDPLEGRVSTGQYRMRFNAFGGFEGGDLILWNKKKTVRVKMDPILGAAYLK